MFKKCNLGLFNIVSLCYFKRWMVILQLAVVTGERDNLRNIINELKRPKNEEAAEVASGIVVQVLKFY